MGFRVVDGKERLIFTSEIKFQREINKVGRYQFEVKLSELFLVIIKIKLTLYLHISSLKLIDCLKERLSFEIFETDSELHIHGGNDYGCVFVDCDWKVL